MEGWEVPHIELGRWAGRGRLLLRPGNKAAAVSCNLARHSRFKAVMSKEGSKLSRVFPLLGSRLSRAFPVLRGRRLSRALALPLNFRSCCRLLCAVQDSSTPSSITPFPTTSSFLGRLRSTTALQLLFTSPPPSWAG